MFSLCSGTPDPPERSISPAMIDTWLKKTAGWQVPSYSRRRAVLVGTTNTFIADRKGWRSCAHANSLLLSNLSYALSMLTYSVKHDLNSCLDGDEATMNAAPRCGAAASGGGGGQPDLRISRPRRGRSRTSPAAATSRHYGAVRVSFLVFGRKRPLAKSIIIQG
jgi:hypothetical protein